MIYLLCNEGYVSTAERAQSRDLVEDAEWLASLLHQLMPTEPEVAGLLALIRLHRARAAARFDRDGGLVLLMLLTLAPSPVTRLHRAIALRHASGPGAAMAELDTLAGALARYHLYHATRADQTGLVGHHPRAGGPSPQARVGLKDGDYRRGPARPAG